MNDNNTESSLDQLNEMMLEHRDLDDAIVSLTANPHVDQLQIGRLKKRKLALKTSIERLRSQIIPDLNA